MYLKTLLCLANSKKTSGRCIAGRELLEDGRYGPWVRPVSARPTEEVSEAERQYEDGGDPQILDVVTVPMHEPAPHHHQVENHRLDPHYYWVRQRVALWGEVMAAVQQPASLWANVSSTRAGMYDRIPEAEAITQGGSLYLIQPQQLVVLRTCAPGAPFGDPKRKVRAQFTYNRVGYDIVVTDPQVERARLAIPGDHRLEVRDALLCVSLAEAYDGYAYKLVAAVITPDRAGSA